MDHPQPEIDVKDQARLSLGRTFSICLKGIRHRLFRSVLTMMVIVLAVAFFMTLLAGSVFARSVDRGARSERTALQRAPEAIDRWFEQKGPLAIQARLARAEPAGIALIASVAERPEPEIEALAVRCRREASLLTFFASLDSGSRVVLVRKARDRAILAWLADETHWREFAQRLAQMRSLSLPMPMDEARQVVQSAPALASEVALVTDAWNARVARLREAVAALAGTTDSHAWQGWLVAADAGGRKAFSAILAGHGFKDDAAPEILDPVLDSLRGLLLRERVVTILGEEEVRKRWKQTFLDSPSLDEKLLRLDDPRAVAVLGGGLGAAELASVAAAVAREREVQGLERAVVGKVSADGALLSLRQSFLVAISFVVCAVGIANAMLMAITERFREIATMKCLGATDGFILTQFLMEAGMQGAAGGAAGTVLGLIIVLIKDGILYGSWLWTFFPAVGIVLSALACIGVGLVLATLASIYPSWMASRMAPMEAMRVE